MSGAQGGGFAFPSPENEKNGWGPEYGMSLRDWFAGQVIGGIGNWTPFARGRETDAEARARYAYETADAMLVARASGGFGQ